MSIKLRPFYSNIITYTQWHFYSRIGMKFSCFHSWNEQIKSGNSVLFFDTSYFIWNGYCIWSRTFLSSSSEWRFSFDVNNRNTNTPWQRWKNVFLRPVCIKLFCIFTILVFRFDIRRSCVTCGRINRRYLFILHWTTIFLNHNMEIWTTNFRFFLSLEYLQR